MASLGSHRCPAPRSPSPAPDLSRIHRRLPVVACRGGIMRVLVTFAVALVTCIGAVSYCGYVCYEALLRDPGKKGTDIDAVAEPVILDCSKRVPVALNRGPLVLDGFRGDVHPALSG